MPREPGIRKQKVTFDDVRRIGLRLPDVGEGTMYGSPALKLRGKLLTCLAVHKSAEPDTLAVRIDFSERDELIEADPKTYYVTEHYVDYPVVLVRLTSIRADALGDLLGAAWRFVNARKPAPRRLTARPRR
jgi:hypothetical protein